MEGARTGGLGGRGALGLPTTLLLAEQCFMQNHSVHNV